MERTGRSLPEVISLTDHPVCAASVASRHFVSGAATPPQEEGNGLHQKSAPGASVSTFGENSMSLYREHYLNAGYGVKSWLLTKDHKRIALLYLFSVTLFFFLGGAFA